MENKFQTTFIPKKPIVSASTSTSSGFNLFTVVGVLIFVISLVLAGGAYFYKDLLNKQIAISETALNSMVDKFEPTTIDVLVRTDIRLKTVSQLLDQHVAISPIFAQLQLDTAKIVRLQSFNFASNPDGTIKLKIKGQARDFATIAFQADQLARQKEFMLNQLFSNFVVNQDSSVGFDFTADVDTNSITYKNWLEKKNSTYSQTTN